MKKKNKKDNGVPFLKIVSYALLFILLLYVFSFIGGEYENLKVDKEVCYKAVPGGLFSPNYLVVDCDSPNVDVRRIEKVYP